MKDHNFNETVNSGIENNRHIQKRGKSRKLKIMIAIIVVILLIAAINYNVIMKSFTTSNYYSKYKSTFSDLRISEKQCESVISEVSNLWYHSTYGQENLNFKATIDALYSGTVSSSSAGIASDLHIEKWMKDSEVNNFRRDISDIKSMQIEIAKEIKYLANPPDKYKVGYNEMLSLYKIYQELCDRALSPNGKYQSYATDVNEKTDDFKAEYGKIQIMFPDLDE